MGDPPHVLPPLPDEDRLLIARAGACVCGAAVPSNERLRDLAASHGIDFATAALYHHVRCGPGAPFIDRVEGAEVSPPHVSPPQVSPPDVSAPPGDVPRVVVMPGAFAAEYPQTGADGARVIDLAARLGWPAERVAVPSLAPMTENAAALVRVLSRGAGRPTVVVSLSKGGADVRAALERPDAAAALRDVRAWVNLSGMVAGTPLVAWLRARPLRCCGVRLLLRLRRQRFAVLDELRHGAGAPLGRPLVLPPGLRVIHVVGFPLRRHLSGDWARRGHARLAPLGPNDGGGVLLADVARLPGDLYPVWGADHYLRPTWDVTPLLLRILREGARDPQPRAGPAAPPPQDHARAPRLQ